MMVRNPRSRRFGVPSEISTVKLLMVLLLLLALLPSSMLMRFCTRCPFLIQLNDTSKPQEAFERLSY